MKKNIPVLAVGMCLATGLFSNTSKAEDWPQWLGPEGSNQVAGEGFAPDLSHYSVAWEKQIGVGYASITVAEGLAFAMGHDAEGKETVYCLDANTGKEKWHYSYEAELLPRMHKGGPNATPTFDGSRLFVLSKDGQLHSLKVADGSTNWKVNLVEVLGVKVPNWGFASSPVLHDGHIYVAAGKTAAIDAATGDTLWVTSDENQVGYTTPVVFKRDSKEYIAALDGAGLSILQSGDGKELARHPWKAQFNMQATTPVVLDHGNRIFVSGNMNSELLAFDGAALSSVWNTKEIKNAMNNSVIAGGVIYGIDGKQGNRNSRLFAADLSSGNILWTKDGFGFGNTIGVGDHILSLNEAGELAVTDINKLAFKEVSRKKVLDSTCWTTPVFANQRIYVRNDVGHLICLSKS